MSIYNSGCRRNYIVKTYFSESNCILKFNNGEISILLNLLFSEILLYANWYNRLKILTGNQCVIKINIKLETENQHDKKIKKVTKNIL